MFNKIFYCNNVDWIQLFGDFMKEWLNSNKFLEFYDIIIPSIFSLTCFLETAYRIPKLMRKGKENILYQIENTYCGF